MKKIVLLAFALVLLSMSIFGTRLVITISGSTTLHVYPGQSIQDAINSAQSGDVIVVHNGTYYENVVLNKSLTLVGEDTGTTIIDGNGTGTVVYITANNINIMGFTIQNSHITPPDGAATPSRSSGIYVDVSIGNNISQNIITKNTFGIFLYGSGNNILSDNIASLNTWDGIQLDESGGNILADNSVSNNGYNGIRLELSSNGNTLTGNNASLNNETGIVLLFSNNNILTDNNAFLNNNTGIRLELSSNNILTGNNVSNNEYGIELSNSDNNVLTGNNASNNRYNFGVLGDSFSHFNNYVDTSNMVDGKPIYYLIDVANAVYDAQTNAGTIYLINSDNITITDLIFTKNRNGVFFFNTRNSKIENVTASNNVFGIQLGYSDKNTLTSNNASNNVYGIWLSQSGNNTLTFNTVRSNDDAGLTLWVYSSNNTISHNNFLSNAEQVFTHQSTNLWDNGLEGNYWSDYNGTDSDEDGIGNTPYIVAENNTDHYPLMGMFSDFPVSWEEETYHLTTVCNSSISAFEFDQVNGIIRFNVTGEGGTGFCRVCIPYNLMGPPYTVTVDGHSPQYVNYTLYNNGTHRWIYFTYLHSTHKVEIIPEFPTWTSILLILMVLTVAIVIYKRRLLKTPIH